MSLRRHRLLIGLLVVAAAAALVLMVRSAASPDEDADSGSSELVERYIPAPNTEVLRQAELGVDLAPTYEGTLLVNGVEIPERELRLVPEQGQVFFTPAEGKVVERLNAGPNCVTAIVWKASEGRGTPNDRELTWCFEAT
jgi:hypothetical protein